jgi:hypothetical protein
MTSEAHPHPDVICSFDGPSLTFTGTIASILA